MSTIRAVLFDLDGTLYDRDAALRAFASDQYERLRGGFRNLSRVDFVEKFVTLDARGLAAKRTVYEAILAATAKDSGSADSVVLDYERRFATHCRAPDDLHPTLDMLGVGGIRLGIITNGQTVLQTATIAALGLEERVDAILISQAEGMRKPDRALFMRALARLGCSPDVAVFVGDHPEADIAGAARAGLRTIWRRTPAFPRPDIADAEIESLRELPAILAAW